jgi:hypothetical protein
VIVSDKQSLCLVNTDALDLTVPNANLTTRGLELRTSCGGPKALWIREVLEVGWADTYGQGVGSGAFDITDLRNGAHYVRVQVNPLGSLFEADTSNNVQDRLIRLRGRPGHRRVIVPRWQDRYREHLRLLLSVGQGRALMFVCLAAVEGGSRAPGPVRRWPQVPDGYRPGA